MINSIEHISTFLMRQAAKPDHTLKLSKADAISLVKAFNHSATVNIRLQAAARRYKSKTQ